MNQPNALETLFSTEKLEEDAEEEEEVFGPKVLWNNFGHWHKSTTSKTPSPFWHLDPWDSKKAGLKASLSD